MTLYRCDGIVHMLRFKCSNLTLRYFCSLFLMCLILVRVQIVCINWVLILLMLQFILLLFIYNIWTFFMKPCFMCFSWDFGILSDIFPSLFITLASHEFSKAARLFQLLTQYCSHISTHLASWDWISAYKTFVLLTYCWQSLTFAATREWSVSLSLPERWDTKYTWMPSSVLQDVISLVVSLPKRRGLSLFMDASVWEHYALWQLTHVAVAKFTTLNGLRVIAFILSWGICILNSNSTPVAL
jgi:hypothetical protein